MTDNDSNKMKAIIVDDEELARQGLERCASTNSIT